MKKAALLLILFSFSISWVQAQTAEDSIRQVYADYKASLLQGNGKQAAQQVDKQTTDYYYQMAQLAIYATEKELKDKGILEKIMILGIRHRTTYENLKTMNGYEIFVFAVDEGMVDKNTVVDVDLGKITVSDGFAKAKHMNKGKETPLFMHFYLENGAWKLNLTDIIPILSVAVEQLMEQENIEEEEFLKLMLHGIIGIPESVDIWKPLAKRK